MNDRYQPRCSVPEEELTSGHHSLESSPPRAVEGNFGTSFRRLVRLLRVVFSHTVVATFSPQIERWSRLARHQASFEKPAGGPERLRAILEELGGTFLKFGQMLALQPDIMSPEYCRVLSDLLDRVVPFDFEDVENIFHQDLGRGPMEIFDTFESQSIASASIGQVYEASLGGTKVAVKVQRPTALRDFKGDIRLMKLAMILIRKLRLRCFEFLLEPLTEFVEWTEDELDFRREARYLEELHKHSRTRRHQHVPKTFLHFTTRRILVMEFCTGVTILDYLRARERGDEVMLKRLTHQGFDPRQFAMLLVDNFLDQVFVNGLFHADLHPANLMILPDNIVGYLDFGITGGLSPFSRRHLLGMTLAYARGDLETMCDLYFNVARFDAPAAESYRRGLRQLGEQWYERVGGELHLRKSFTVVMLEMLRLSRETGIWAQRDVIKYIRSTVALDGLITRLSPDFNSGQYLEQACARFVGNQNRASMMNSRDFLSSGTSRVRLLIQASLRATAFSERLARGELILPVHRRPFEPLDSSKLAWRLSVVGALILALSLLSKVPLP